MPAGSKWLARLLLGHLGKVPAGEIVGGRDGGLYTDVRSEAVGTRPEEASADRADQPKHCKQARH